MRTIFSINIYIYIFDHSFLGGFGQEFFPSRPQYAILGAGILGQIASFERRLRGAAPTPLALPYPFRIWPGSGTWAERDKREVCKKMYFGRCTPELFLILAYRLYAELERKKRIYGKALISKVAHHFQIGFLFRPPATPFHGHASKRLAHCAHRTTDCCVVAFRYRSSRLNTFLCSSVRCLRGGAFPTQHHYTQCPCSFFILERYNLFSCGHRL